MKLSYNDKITAYAVLFFTLLMSLVMLAAHKVDTSTKLKLDQCHKSHCEAPLKPSYDWRNMVCVCINLATPVE